MTDIILASVVIPNGTEPKPVAQVVFVDGSCHNVTLYGHDWAYDWSNADRAPASLYRWLLDMTGGRIPQGDRKVYESTHWNGSSNEKGRMTVWEIDYDSLES